MGKNRKIPELKRLVVKIGTSSLTYPGGRLNLDFIDKLVWQLSGIANSGVEVILVSSGAIGVGISRFNFSRKPTSVPEKQALAAIGQGILMHLYEKTFAEYGQLVAQILLTRDDVADRTRYLNARSTLEMLLKMKVIPIINENDTVAVEDLNFGDNDLLSALVANLVEADMLVILTDTDGLYTADPRTDKTAELISEVSELDEGTLSFAGTGGSDLGTGGMATKVQAASIAMQSGIMTVIAKAKREKVLNRILEGEQIGTAFYPNDNALDSRSKWIAFAHSVAGKIIIDAGAVSALLAKRKSLLPSGVLEAEGDFTRGSTVDIISTEGQLIARGIVNYQLSEILKIKGLKSKDIEASLGYKYSDEIVHRDNLVILVH